MARAWPGHRVIPGTCTRSRCSPPAPAGPAGRRLEDRIAEVFHIRGKAAEAWIYPADLYASDEFWS
jgi:hypothetical protein